MTASQMKLEKKGETMSYKTHKGEYYITCFRKNMGSNYFFQKIKGTIFEVEDENGAVWKFGIGKDKYTHYRITDIASGMGVTSWHDRKKDVMWEFERREKTILERLNNAMNSDNRYRKFVLELEKIYASEKERGVQYDV